jgi:hypothetical protein
MRARQNWLIALALGAMAHMPLQSLAQQQTGQLNADDPTLSEGQYCPSSGFLRQLMG